MSEITNAHLEMLVVLAATETLAQEYELTSVTDMGDSSVARLSPRMKELIRRTRITFGLDEATAQELLSQLDPGQP